MKDWIDCTAAERVERWEECLRVLEGLDEHARAEHWSMGTWGVITDCGTVACAAGHCGMDPWFQQQGFHLRFWNGVTYFSELPVGKGGCIATSGPVRGFFGHIGAHEIFFDSRSRSVEKVIEEVKEHLEVLRRYL